MGFLQQDTNNIILDAVLTDEGRKRLAANDGSFRVVMFSLGDDEVDYNIIKKFGRNVGREKIEKNTPVFEALTNATLESRSRLITLSDPNRVALATFTLSSDSETFTNVTSSPTRANESPITVTLAGPESSELAPEITDSIVQVSVDRRFLQIPGQTPFATVDNTDFYNVIASERSAQQVTFSVNLTSKTLVDNTFTTFGNSTNKTQITTFATIQGRQSGLSKTVSLTLNKTT